MKRRRKFAIESLETRTVLSVTADVGGPYVINQGEGLQLQANPADFVTNGNGVGNDSFEERSPAQPERLGYSSGRCRFRSFRRF